MGSQRTKNRTAAICITLAVLLLFPVPFASAGVVKVQQEFTQTVDSLGTAYIICDQAYLTLGQPAVWRIALSGRVEGLSYSFSLFFKRLQDAGDYFDGLEEKAFSSANIFEYTAANAGLYYIEAFIRDRAGRTLTLTGEPLLAVPAGDWNERGTVIGTARAVAARCIREAEDSSFGRALWLHDWLIGHADYDDTLNERYPDGVLLRKTGTCQSYALAYQLLLREAGVESILVTGKADGEPHAWNLIKLFGLWYHVDVTWDDHGGPEPGYAYFGLPDVMMGRDHDWSGGNLYPASGLGKYDILERCGYLVFEGSGGMDACMRSALAEKKGSFRLYYAGTDPRFDLVGEIQAWWQENLRDYALSEYRWEASAWEGAVSVAYLVR